MTILDWSKFEDRFGEWAGYIKPFFDEGGFDNIYSQLKKDSLEDKLTPESSTTFRFLKETPPKALKLIIIGQDPYPAIYRNKSLIATGIAFDCSNASDGYIQPSLKSFFEGIHADTKQNITRVPNLTYLCEQGVILGNRALTCKLNKIGSHMGLWDPFWEFFLAEIVTAYFTDVPIILLGKDAHQLKKYIFEIANPTFFLEHPSFASKKEEIWKTEGAFSKVEKILKEKKQQIYWDENLWTLPF